MSAPRVVGRGITRRFGRAVALAGVDLTLAAGSDRIAVVANRVEGGTITNLGTNNNTAGNNSV